MRRLLRAAILTGALLLPATSARAQLADVFLDPALGPRPTFGPGGFLSSGNGYGAVGRRGYGYYTGLPLAGFDPGNGPSPYYSPIYSAIAAAPTERSLANGWAFRPSLPFTGQRNYRLFHRHGSAPAR